MEHRRMPEKWRTIFGLVMIYAAVIANWDWMWGVLYLYWILPDLALRRTHFIEEIDADRHPLLFWFLVITLLALSSFMLAEPLLAKIFGSVS